MWVTGIGSNGVLFAEAWFSGARETRRQEDESPRELDMRSETLCMPVPRLKTEDST